MEKSTTVPNNPNFAKLSGGYILEGIEADDHGTAWHERKRSVAVRHSRWTCFGRAESSRYVERSFLGMKQKRFTKEFEEESCPTAASTVTAASTPWSQDFGLLGGMVKEGFGSSGFLV